jgi:hypothetical protein
MKRRRDRRLALPAQRRHEWGRRACPDEHQHGAGASQPVPPPRAPARTRMRLAAVPASCSHSPSARPRRPLTSAVVFGAAYATIVAIAVIWSTNVFAEQPSASLAAVTVMDALGLMIGPPTLGAVAEHTGPSTALATRTLLLTRHDHAGTTRRAADQRRHRREARAMNPRTERAIIRLPLLPPGCHSPASARRTPAPDDVWQRKSTVLVLDGSRSQAQANRMSADCRHSSAARPLSGLPRVCAITGWEHSVRWPRVLAAHVESHGKQQRACV